ncbi:MULTISPECIES: protein TolQ [Marinobacter]|uniref:Tol-Pal system protein TolQ n=3 Tax=Marinobacter TaxID=2742 RepID=A0A1M2UZ78_MARNT|nr:MULTISPECIES: protein TolQ [Marinobacter]MDX5439904.1 protein TolQ [Alteromonadaceae bacterium]QFT50655.1 Biopolymer transport protein ExbB [Marinobacter sp. THAF39]AMQ90834.1 protein TolQ [Marinobacter sp. LQ44]MAO11797.1 protein TolQ [Marinobacter sp.]OJT00628.1 protein TolQ [Marinobacter nauticus]
MEAELSVWYLIANAGVLVQLVMLLLVLASVVSWALIFQRIQVFRKAKQAQLAFEERFWSGMDLGQLYKEVNADPTPFSGMESVFRAGFKEFSRLRQQSRDADAVMEGTQRAMRVAFSREQERLETHLPFLATVGSTSPYVGLFGTVWGIMNSFRGLAQVQQATLATVAPGISEALIATAMGLFAAIPAVIAYNRFSAMSDALLKNYETFAEEFSSILHRRVHNSDQAA